MKAGLFIILIKKAEEGIAKGKMPLPVALDIIEQVKDHVLIAVLYTNGEPLLYHDLPKVIKYATERRLATMIATNGLLFNDRISQEVLAAGIDLIKIQLSGFTNDIYRIQTRHGDVEKLKSNIERLVYFNNQNKHKAMIFLDFILYKYNSHQLELVRNFCNKLGVMMSVRPGNPKGGLEGKEDPLSTSVLPLKESCPWLWNGMQVNWNGDILPCCESVVWAGAPVYENFKVGETRVDQVWNSPQAQTMRKALAQPNGRGTIDMCSKCLRKGVCLKW